MPSPSEVQKSMTNADDMSSTNWCLLLVFLQVLVVSVVGNNGLTQLLVENTEGSKSVKIWKYKVHMTFVSDHGQQKTMSDE